MLYLLATDPGSAIGHVERAVSGGPAVILGILLVVACLVIAWLGRKYINLEKEFREESKKLLKDQIAQADPLTAMVTTTNDTLKRMDDALKENQTLVTRLNAKLDEAERKAKNDA